ncbi:hypothetical protein [Cryptosporangium japonicum]
MSRPPRGPPYLAIQGDGLVVIRDDDPANAAFVGQGGEILWKSGPVSSTAPFTLALGNDGRLRSRDANGVELWRGP